MLWTPLSRSSRNISASRSMETVFADSGSAYLMVLAEHAFEVAAGEEHRSAAARTAYARLLTVVRRGACDERQAGTGADSAGGIFGSFCAAAARTGVADHFLPLKSKLRCAHCRFDMRLRRLPEMEVVKIATNPKNLKKVHLFRGKCANIYV